jgi:hypothetical protein
MNIEDILFIVFLVAFVITLLSIALYKRMMVGKVQIMKVGHSYAVRQYAGANSFDYISFDDLIDCKWRWLYGGSVLKTCDFPMTMLYEEAERVANLAHAQYLEYRERKRREKQNAKERRLEKKKNKPVLLKTIPRKAD